MLATLPSFGEDLLALRARPSRFYLHFFTVFPLHSVPLHLAALFMLVVVFDRRLSSAEAVRGDQFPHVFGLFDIRNNNGSLATWVEDNNKKHKTSPDEFGGRDEVRRTRQHSQNCRKSAGGGEQVSQVLGTPNSLNPSYKSFRFTPQF